MTNYDSVLSAANQLPEPDRVRFIEELWDTIPVESDAPFSDEWLTEIERRMDDIETGRGQTAPWSQIRDEALARLRHGKDH